MTAEKDHCCACESGRPHTMLPNQIRAPIVKATVLELWGRKPITQIADAISSRLSAACREIGKDAYVVVSPGGVLYKAHAYGLIDEAERDRLHREHRADVARRRRIPAPLRRRLLAEANGTVCPLCRMALHAKNMVIDHIRSIQNGGDSAPDNLRVICAVCNAEKSSACGEWGGTPEEIWRRRQMREQRRLEWLRMMAEYDGHIDPEDDVTF